MIKATRTGHGDDVGSITEGEYRHLARVDHDLVQGRALYESWRKARGMNGALQRFELVEEYRGHKVEGFSGNLQVRGIGSVPVIASVQEIPYTRPKSLPGKERQAAQWIKRQVQAFVLGHFMTAAGYTKPQGYPQLGHPTLPFYLQPFSWCPVKGVIRGGVDFRKIHYKKKSGRFGEFSEQEQEKIGDLREIGKAYDWIVVSTRLFDESFSIDLYGPGTPRLVIPLNRTLYFALLPDLIFDREKSSSGLLGVFGFGLVLVGSERHDWEISLPTFAKISFQVFKSGEVIVRAVFVGRRPKYSLVPTPGFGWTSDHVDLVEMLMPRRSVERSPPIAQLDRQFLLKHSKELYHMIVSTIPAWNECPDWLQVSKCMQAGNRLVMEMR